jgi:hypothetical protein
MKPRNLNNRIKKDKKKRRKKRIRDVCLDIEAKAQLAT